MTPLCSESDVETRLSRSLTNEESERVQPGLIQEASVKVLAHMRKPETYYDGKEVPLTVRIVTSRSIARLLEQLAKGIAPGTQQTSAVAGPFSGQTTYLSGTTNGSPWLTLSDKADLDNINGDNRIFAVDRVAAASPAHSVACSLNFGATYCSCGADIAGTQIYGA